MRDFEERMREMDRDGSRRLSELEAHAKFALFVSKFACIFAGLALLLGVALLMGN